MNCGYTELTMPENELRPLGKITANDVQSPESPKTAGLCRRRRLG
jgi:hypothetical protein